VPRVHHVKKARKDNPVAKVGESYYWWKNFRSPKKFSKTFPKRSQLTGSDKLSRLYGAAEDVSEIDSWETQAAIDTIKSAAEEVRQVGEEYQESADNIRDTFSESETADECEEKAYDCESVADSMEKAAISIEDFRYNYKGWPSEAAEKMSDFIIETIQNIDFGLAE
jgi:hypothetical protein